MRCSEIAPAGIERRRVARREGTRVERAFGRARAANCGAMDSVRKRRSWIAPSLRCRGGIARLLIGFVVAIGLLPSIASAHKASDSYLQVEQRDDGLAVRWDIALRD